MEQICGIPTSEPLDSEDADLREAGECGNANLSRADLDGADLRGADLSGANLKSATVTDRTAILRCIVGWGNNARWIGASIDDERSRDG